MTQYGTWEPKPSSPPYIVISINDVWSMVENKWESLGSPDAQCPSPQFGALGSAQNNACREAVGPLWDRFKQIIPEWPKSAPHYGIVDAVPVEDICALGWTDDPEADIGPVPNLFENPGALAQKLQEWYLRSKVRDLCQRVDIPPMSGGCFCWPYFVKVSGAYIDASGGPDVPIDSTTPVWGPIRSAGHSVEYREDGSLVGTRIFVVGQANDGGFPSGNTDTCLYGSQEYNAGGYSAGIGVRNLTIVEITPFTLADMAFYGISHAALLPPSSQYCPTPTTAPPLGDYPNSKPVYMPLPVPVFRFPSAPGCPVGEEDYLIFTVNVEGAVGPPGPKGDKGEDGEGGGLIVKKVVKTQGTNVLGETVGGGGEFCLEVSVPTNCAMVEVEFLIDDSDEAVNAGRRVYFENPDMGKASIEGSFGNIHLKGGYGLSASLPRIQCSRVVTLVDVPEPLDSQNWTVYVVDKGDVGVRITDMGYRHVLRAVSNPDDVPTFDYYE
jgi:hypothetical protein